MNDDNNKQTVDESLTEVLNSLEELLGQKDPDYEAASPAPIDESEPDNGEESPDSSEQLPLLQDVVVPGSVIPASAVGTPDSSDAPHLEPVDCNDLTQRLVSELEVIIEGSVDELLKQAKTEIRAKLRTHLEIVLPEILEEMSNRRG